MNVYFQVIWAFLASIHFCAIRKSGPSQFDWSMPHDLGLVHFHWSEIWNTLYYFLSAHIYVLVCTYVLRPLQFDGYLFEASFRYNPLNFFSLVKEIPIFSPFVSLHKFLILWRYVFTSCTYSTYFLFLMQ